MDAHVVCVCVMVQSPQLVKKKDEQPLTVNQFQLSGWDKNVATPTSTLRGSLMTLLEMVERSQIKTGNHAVVIHCMYVGTPSLTLLSAAYCRNEAVLFTC